MENVSKKDKALELMKQLNIYKAFRDEFKKDNLVCYFEHFIGYWDYQKPEVEAKRKEIEKRYNCLVYASVHQFTEIGEMYSFLLVNNYPEEWDYLVEHYGGNKYRAMAYVWNKTDDECSELGSVIIQSALGGLRRIG